MAAGEPIGLLLALTQAAGGAEFSPSKSDTVTVSESVTVRLISFVQVSDTVTVTENVEMGGVPNPNVSDTISVGEAIMVSLRKGVAVMESISVTEFVNVVLSDPQINVDDTVTVSESVNLQVALSVRVSDGVTVSENVELLQTSFISVSDDILVTESVNVTVSGGLDTRSTVDELPIDRTLFLNTGEIILSRGGQLVLAGEGRIVQMNNKLVRLPDGQIAYRLSDSMYLRL